MVGLVLTVGGAGALAAGLGLFGGALASSTLGDAVSPLAGLAWVPYVIAVVAVIVAVLALRWLLVQGRTPSIDRFRVATDPGEGRTEVMGASLSQALEDGVGRCPGVSRARARLIGSLRQPRVRLDVVLTDDADPRAVWEYCATEVVPRARETLEVDELRTVIRMSVLPAGRRERALA
ncbi:hypothetical protein J4H86_15350 [Spiractinospora alimapuensis]|nr:hypothetical protein J4H86_15350 [Spiractinospora alimapuensis]